MDSDPIRTAPMYEDGFRTQVAPSDSAGFTSTRACLRPATDLYTTDRIAPCQPEPTPPSEAPRDNTNPKKRKTYPQNWPAYNAAQTSEKDTFMLLLADLCAGVEQPEYNFGRPRFPLADMVYTGAMKVYSGFSARRFTCDVQDARRKGFLNVAPSFNSVNRYIGNPDLTPILTDLIMQSAAPLSVVESQFAAESSGFSTCRFNRWFDEKWGKGKSQRQWLKAHVMAGTKTNVVTSIIVTDSNANDSPVLPALLVGTAEHFNMKEVSADKAYLSNNNFKKIEGHGAAPYIPFKSNTTGKGSPMWRRLYAYFMLNESEWKEHYHPRSNVETVFSMVKGRFGDALRSKSETGQVPPSVRGLLYPLSYEGSYGAGYYNIRHLSYYRELKRKVNYKTDGYYAKLGLECPYTVSISIPQYHVFVNAENTRCCAISHRK